MKKLTTAAQERATSFMTTKARLLERTLYELFVLGTGTKDRVLNELATFQNEDGGFGHGLEPDVQTPASSVLATTEALQTLRALGVTSAHPLVRDALAYLQQTYDPAQHTWPLVPEQVDKAPHAPWWQHQEDLSGNLANPRAEIVGYFFEYGELVTDELRRELLDDVLAHLQELPNEMEMHDLMCYVRLAETEALPEEARRDLKPRLQRAVATVVARGQESWAAYGLKPATVAPLPDSLFAEALAPLIGEQLDFEIEAQEADGSWSPNWSWGDTYPDAWPEARRAWQGIITYRTMRTLQAYGRLA